MSNANTLELGMLELINAERASAGLDPLNLITLLNDAAETHSRWMLDANQFSHSGDGGSSPFDRMDDAGYPFEGSTLSAENIGWQSLRGEEGAEDDVAQVHASLMNSPGHRANILNPNAEDVGLGIEVGTFSGANGDFEAVMVTQVFGTTDADISAWIDPETGDDDTDVIDVPVIDDVEDTPVEPDTPEAEDEPDTPDDIIAEPVDSDDDEDPIIAEDMPTEDDVPEIDPDTETPTDDSPDTDTESPVEDMPEVIAIDDVPGCALTTLSVDISDVFEIKRDGEQITLETTEDKLITAFMNAFDDWAFLNEAPDSDEVMDVTDLMLEGLPADDDGFTCQVLEDDAEQIAAQCI